VREFLTGVMLVPATFNFFWMTVFGSSALDIQLFGDGELVKAVTEDPSVSLFAFLEHYPLATITSVVAVFIVLLFFITSANSGAVVVATITSNGYDPSLRQRIFWALGIGGVAAALMFGGGLTALQAATITTGLPFAIILLFIAYALIKALQRQYPAPKTHERSAEEG
jgi:choline/glycine/proline betaine transport protein